MTVLLVFLMVTTLMSACKNEKSPTQNDPTNPTAKVEPASYSARTYMIDQWRVDLDDGSREYYITLLMHSNDYSARPTSEDVKYHTDDGYYPIEDSFDNAVVEVYQPELVTNGTCAYAKIKTSQLIDTKKIHVQLSGPKEYQEGIQTKDDYVAINGSADGWCSVLTQISSMSTPNAEALKMQKPNVGGLLRLSDEKYSQYYYAPTEQTGIVDKDRIWSKFTIDALKNATLDNAKTHITQHGEPVNFENGIAKKVELDKRLKIVCDVVDGCLWVGVATVDGSDIAQYDGEIPDMIVYFSNREAHFLIAR